MKLLAMHFSQVCCYVIPLRPTYLPYHHVFKQLQPIFFLNVRNWFSLPCKTEAELTDFCAHSLNFSLAWLSLWLYYVLVSGLATSLCRGCWQIQIYSKDSASKWTGGMFCVVVSISYGDVVVTVTKMWLFVWNLIADIVGGKEAEGVWEHGVEENIWTEEGRGIGEWRRLHNEELNDLYSSPNTERVIKLRRMRWAGHVAHMGEERGVYRVLVGKPEGKRPLGRPRRRWVDNIRMELQEVGCGYMDWIGLARDRERWWKLVSVVMNLRVPWNAGNFLTSCKPVSFSRRTLHHGVSKYWMDILYV